MTLLITSAGVLNGSNGARINSLPTPNNAPNLAVSLPTPKADFAAQAALTPTLNTGNIKAILSGSRTPATKAPPNPALSYIVLFCSIAFISFKI